MRWRTSAGGCFAIVMVFTFSLDKYTAKWVPASIVPRLPHWVSRWLGCHKRAPLVDPLPDYLRWVDVLVGSFASMMVLQGVFNAPGGFVRKHHAPGIIASYGATAILAFNTTAVPLAQPRNILMGHFVSSLIGVCVQKLFGLSAAGRERYDVGGALSVGIASVLMSVLNCVHPPAGASALLPCADETVRAMSWWYLPAQLLSSVLIIAVACLTNNVFRKYPEYWWIASSPAPPAPKRSPDPFSSVSICSAAISLPPSLSLTSSQRRALEEIQLQLK